MANVTIQIREGDMDYLKNATTVSTYWFIDCKYYGQTNDFNFSYNFTNSDTSHVIEALIVASHDSPTITTVTPPTTTIIPFPINVSDITVSNVTTEAVTTMIPDTNVTMAPRLTTTATSDSPNTTLNTSTINMYNISLPYICSNSSIIPPDPNKTYGHFTKKIYVRGE